MAAGAYRPGPSADSYIGSLISLTSKSEIRYEGILYSINTEESSIGLRNVRSFGTEGRKKDGPQIFPSNKIYEFILFRGSDIMDLQVKSSPHVQATPIHQDPAIIQSHYSPSVPASTPAASGAVPDLNSDASQRGVPRSTFHGGFPLYQPGVTVGSWDSTSPAANGSGLAIPTYWQGFYAPPSSGVSHSQHPSLYHPPPGLPTNSVLQPVQFPNINSFLPSGTPSLNEFSSTLMPLARSAPSLIHASLQQEVYQPNINSLLSAPSLAEFSSPVLSASGSNPSLVPTQASLLASESPLNLMTNKPPLNSVVASNFGLSFTVPQNALPGLGNNPSAIVTPSLSTQMISQSMPSIISSSVSKEGGSLLPLVTPGQLLHPGYSMLPSSLPLQTSHKDAEAKPLEVKTTSTSETLMCELSPALKEPLLPLPEPANRRTNGAASFAYQRNSRGRGRGRANAFSEPITTEEFDFSAMNEKFNKDEVWGHLGKGKVLAKYDERELDEKHVKIDPDEDQEEYLELEIKVTAISMQPVYCKDDFFDTLSGNIHNQGIRGGRIRFPHQMKADTETFSELRMHRWNRGRAFRGGRGGRGRGYYYDGGGGNGFNNRGRGRIT